jgi:hypothetical protein
LRVITDAPGVKKRFAWSLRSGQARQNRIKPTGRKYFWPIPLSGLPKQLQSQEWRKDLLMSWLFQTCIRLQTSLDRRFLRFGMTVQEE